MLKHVSRTSLACSMSRSRLLDTVSLHSNYSSCGSAGSASPDNTLSSRSSSYISLADTNQPYCQQTPMVPMKIYARCLRPDIEYKTLSVNVNWSCKQLIQSLLVKCRLRHHDPNLYYLTMEINIRKSGGPVRTVMVLDEETRPAELQACYPRGEARFCLQMRRGGVVKVCDSVLMPASQYKSVLLSERTTTEELVQLLLNCYSSKETPHNFCIYETCQTSGFERKLHPSESPLMVVRQWCRDSMQSLVLRRETGPSSSASSPWCLPSRHSVIEEEPPKFTFTPPPPPVVQSYNDYENYFYI